MKSSSPKGHLEDVIVQVEKSNQKKQLSRSSSSKKLNSSSPSSSNDDPMNESTDILSDSEMEENGGGNVYQELAQKEKDLILAAEVGKALLERNEELTLANEKITEEYSHKLEVSVPLLIPLDFHLFLSSLSLLVFWTTERKKER